MRKIEKIDTISSYETAHFIDDNIVKNNILKVNNILDYNITEQSRVINDMLFGINLLTNNRKYEYVSNIFYSNENYNSNMMYYSIFYNNVDEYGYHFLLENLKEYSNYSFLYKIALNLFKIEMNRFKSYITDTEKYKNVIYKNNKLVNSFFYLVKDLDFFKVKYIKNIKYENYKFYILEIDDNYEPIYFYNTGSKLKTKEEYIEECYNAHDLLNIINMNVILKFYRNCE